MPPVGIYTDDKPERTAVTVGDTDAPHWHNCGLCKKNPDLFYPERRDKDQIAAAVAVCFKCPVRQPCLDQALATREQFGIWGGTTELERERIRRNSPAA